MLEHIIDRAKLEGFNHFVLAIHYLGHMIEAHFGNGERLGVQIDYLREETPLGTAGALGLLNQLPNAPFVVTNGDVITDIHYGELLDFHTRHAATATMAVRLHEWQHPFGVVQTQGIEIVGFEEKPIARSHINAGIYALENNVERLKDDHENARKLARRLAQIPGIAIDASEVETNLVFFDVAGTGKSGAEVSEALLARGVHIGAPGSTRMRAVTHLDISENMIDEAADIIAEVVS